jgi:geranylgeranyl reductase family protein
MDVAIVGAGPAGAWAAYALARRGARVTMFDASHPREKPCGGGVTGRALDLVNGAAGERDESCARGWPAVAIRSVRFIDSRHGRSPLVPMDDGALVVASRAAFDAALLAAAERAGAVLVAARVSDVSLDASGVVLETTRGRHRAAFLIGADGANSLVRRRLSRPFRRDQLSLATGFFARGTTSDEIVIEMMPDPPGYVWSFPRPDHLAVGICAQADAGAGVDALRARTLAWIRDARIAIGARLDPYAWPIPSLAARDFESLAPAGPRWFLVGDAAGLVDPITREGIYFAVASGAWAAEAIAGSQPDREYRARVLDDAAPELACAARLKAGFFRPAFSGLMLGALEQSGAIRAVMADLVAGRQSYRRLRRRLLTTFEWRLAARALLMARSSRLAP